jgi:hypothetical protein
VPRLPTQTKIVCKHVKARDNENVDLGSGEHKKRSKSWRKMRRSHPPHHTYEAVPETFDCIRHAFVGTHLIFIASRNFSSTKCQICCCCTSSSFSALGPASLLSPCQLSSVSASASESTIWNACTRRRDIYASSSISKGSIHVRLLLPSLHGSWGIKGVRRAKAGCN